MNTISEDPVADFDRSEILANKQRQCLWLAPLLKEYCEKIHANSGEISRYVNQHIGWFQRPRFPVDDLSLCVSKSLTYESEVPNLVRLATVLVEDDEVPSHLQIELKLRLNETVHELGFSKHITSKLLAHAISSGLIRDIEAVQHSSSDTRNMVFILSDKMMSEKNSGV
ncbi:MAG: hypothetical protein ACRC8S_19600 [Fimbriiglobus sp.]